ncbi:MULTISPECIES: hypothetical protein [unclassified Nocardiopsis]|uniref:hypothetical protein n=1 Tax=unclassified Nocardiopsis TaxID=2649073 RepID=UPI001356ADF7|nr:MULTISPECIES: hypothetical protein [unclassified Nocardiopsis]
MKRKRALELLEHLLRNLDAQRDEWPLNLVTEVNVFGSFSRGALEPHDVDVDIEHEVNREWAVAATDLYFRGRKTSSLFRQSLLQKKRGCELFLNGKREWEKDFSLVTLWRRGETLETALERLHAIPVDTSAGRAPRDAMIPEFEGLDHWLPLWLRERFITAVDQGSIRLERLRLDDAEVASAIAAQHIKERWVPTSPLRRAASAVVGYWERLGIDPTRTHLHGENVHTSNPEYFAGFGLRYVTTADIYFLEEGAVEWIEVVHPTRTQPMDCLKITPLDTTKLVKTPLRFSS